VVSSTEASYYGLNGVDCIEEIAQRDNNPTVHITVLRVMHCQQLTSLKGVSEYSNITELNVSSNNLLSMSGLETLCHLKHVNLSCNKISQIFSVEHLARSLRSLNLSHNRIVSILPLQDLALSKEAVLSSLDLTDNYIGELN